MRLHRFHAHGMTTYPPGRHFAEITEPMSGKLFFVVDVSNSMAGGRLRDAVRGARELREQAVSDSYSVGVISFNTSARVVQGLTPDMASAARALERLRTNGGTDLAAGIRMGHEALRKRRGERVLALFSDGETDRRAALEAATAARGDGIRIIATIAGQADAAFMKEIVSEDTDVFKAPDGDVAREVARLGRYVKPTYR